MRFILRWFIRLFGVYVLVRGIWMLSIEWRLHRFTGMHRRMGSEDFSYLGDQIYLIEYFITGPYFLLTLSGLIIIVLAFRR